jgi:hypothetical protein
LRRAPARRCEIVGESPEAYLRLHQEHPMSVVARPVLERAGTASVARDGALVALKAGNEIPTVSGSTVPTG